MSYLSDKTREHLRAAGWTEGRAVAIDVFEEANREAGFHVGTQAKLFLREFGNLRLRYPDHKVPEHEDECSFDAVWAAGMAIPEAIEDYERAIGQRLTVIGESHHQHMTLCMDEDGRVYGGFEGVLVRFGESGEDAIDALCEGREGEHIDVVPQEIPPGQRGIELAEAARIALLQGGWAEGETRFATIEEDCDRFLAEFAGVSFKYPNTACGVDICRIDRVTVPDDCIRAWSDHLQLELLPIGELQESGVVLLMDQEGRVFGGMKETADVIWLFGVSGIDAINNLITEKIAIRIS